MRPIQSYNGYDHPWAAGGGKNKLPPHQVGSNSSLGMTYTYNADESITVQGDPTGNFAYCPIYGVNSTTISALQPLLDGFTPGGPLTMTIDGNPSGIDLICQFNKADGTLTMPRATSSKYATTVPDDAVYMFVALRTQKSLVTPPIDAKIRVLVGNGSAVEDYSPYSNICPIYGHTSATAYVCADAPHIYGVVWNQTDAKMTSRFGDAASITLDTTNFGNFGSVNPDYSNPFDSIYPWNGRKLCNIDIDAYRALTSGDSITDCVTAWEGDAEFSYTDQYGVWVYTPQFWGKSWYNENGNRMFAVADKPYGTYLYYPEQITGRYFGCGVTLTIDGTDKTCNLPTLGIPLANVALSTQHTYAKNYGGSLTDIYSVDASLLLMIVEYATMNSQNAIGQGAASLYVQGLHPAADVTNSNTLVMPATNANFVVGAIVDIGTTDGGYNIARTSITAVNGATLTLADAVTATTAHFVSIHGLVNVADEEIGSESGYIGTNGKATAYYRGEELYGNKWQYILGAYRQTGTAHVWVASRSVTDNYDALNTSAHTDTGVVLASNADVATDGYIDALGLCDGFAAAPFATAVGGNETNPVGDRIYSPNTSAANTILLLGGRTGGGAGAGAFCGSWGYPASYSSWNGGSRPRLKIPREGVARGTLPLA